MIRLWNEMKQVFPACVVGVFSGWIIAYAVIYSAAAMEALQPLEKWERPFLALLGFLGALIALQVTGNGFRIPSRAGASSYEKEIVGIRKGGARAVLTRLTTVNTLEESDCLEARIRFVELVEQMTDEQFMDAVYDEWLMRGGDQIDWIVYGRWEKAWLRLIARMRKVVGK